MDLRERFRRKQDLASPSRYYGDGGTIHGSNYLDVETDADGRVVSVWFRCQMLPFRQTSVGEVRVAEMLGAEEPCLITGVEVLDPSSYSKAGE